MTVVVYKKYIPLLSAQQQQHHQQLLEFPVLCRVGSVSAIPTHTHSLTHMFLLRVSQIANIFLKINLESATLFYVMPIRKIISKL